MAETGREVVAQANDTSLFNTEPVVLKNTIIGVVSALLSILVLGGYIEVGERDAIEGQLAILIPALLILAQIISGIWARASAYSPQTAAKIALVNASKPIGSAPTLLPPP